MRVETGVASRMISPSGRAPGGAAGGFGRMVEKALDDLSNLQAEADRAAESVATGDMSKLQEAVVKMQEASLTVELVVAVRNHLVDGIQELLRTQV